MGRQPEIKTKLRGLRLMRKLSKNFVAARAKIAEGTLMQLERNHMRASQGLRARLANLYGLPESTLFDDDGYPLGV